MTHCTYTALTIIITTDTGDNIFRAATPLASTWQTARTGTEDTHKWGGYNSGDHTHNNNDDDYYYYGGIVATRLWVSRT